jgi:DNA-binding MarR family transcriptional regulator
VGPRARKSARGESDAIAEIVQSFHRLFKSVDTFSKYTLRKFGVSGPQIWALRTVAEGGRITIGDLAERMHLHISTVSGILDRLERAKLVVRERSDEDRRTTYLTVTRKGMSVIARAPEPPRAKLSRKLARLGPREVASLLRGLRQLVDLVEVERIESTLSSEDSRARGKHPSNGA